MLSQHRPVGDHKTTRYRSALLDLCVRQLEQPSVRQDKKCTLGKEKVAESRVSTKRWLGEECGVENDCWEHDGGDWFALGLRLSVRMRLGVAGYVGCCKMELDDEQCCCETDG